MKRYFGLEVTQEDPRLILNIKAGRCMCLQQLHQLEWHILLHLPQILQLCKALNQNSLENGSLDQRLFLSDEFTHLPTPAVSKHSECQLHKWADKRTRKQIAYCSDCNVCLCIQCYKAFHTVLDLRRVKNDLQNDRSICNVAVTSKMHESPLSEMTLNFSSV